MTTSIPTMRILPIMAASLTLTACGFLGGGDDVDENATGQKAERAEVAAKNEDLVTPVAEQIGTPMAERVATLGFLNKRNGLTRDLELKPGQSIRIGRAIVRMRACERTAPWELTPEHGAFVQLLVNDRPATRSGEDKFRKVFSGWLFRESPSLNVVEHPIYDVWVKKCEMSFPGEEDTPSGNDPTAPRTSDSNVANRSNRASSSPNDGGDAGANSSTADDEVRDNPSPAATPAPRPSTPTPAPAATPAPAPRPSAPAPASDADPIGDFLEESGQ